MNPALTSTGAAGGTGRAAGGRSKSVFAKKGSYESKLISLAKFREPGDSEPRNYLYLDRLSSSIHTPKSALTTGTKLDIVPKIQADIKTQFDEPETRLLNGDGSLTEEYKLESRNTAAAYDRHILSLDARKEHKPDRLQGNAFNEKISKKLQGRVQTPQDQQFRNVRGELADLQREFASLPNTTSTNSDAHFHFEHEDAFGMNGEVSAFGTQSKVRVTPPATGSSMTASATPASPTGYGSRQKKSSKKYEGLKERPKKIFSRDSLIQCIMDTTEFHVEARSPVLGNTTSTASAGSPGRGSTMSLASKSGKWAQESLEFAYQQSRS